MNESEMDTPFDLLRRNSSARANQVTVADPEKVV
jgi:hypothetical protein